MHTNIIKVDKVFSPNNMEKTRPYSRSIKETINSILPDINRSLLPILDNRPIEKALFIAVSADRGMAGGFNANVIKRVWDRCGMEADQNAFAGTRVDGVFKSKWKMRRVLVLRVGIAWVQIHYNASLSAMSYMISCCAHLLWLRFISHKWHLDGSTLDLERGDLLGSLTFPLLFLILELLGCSVFEITPFISG